MALKSMKFGGGKQKPSAQPVMRHRAAGTPVQDQRVFSPEDPLRHPAHDEGDNGSYYDFSKTASGSPVADVKINPAGS